MLYKRCAESSFLIQSLYGGNRKDQRCIVHPLRTIELIENVIVNKLRLFVARLIKNNLNQDSNNELY